MVLGSCWRQPKACVEVVLILLAEQCSVAWRGDSGYADGAHSIENIGFRLVRNSAQ
jgi:hypothetical protein